MFGLTKLKKFRKFYCYVVKLLAFKLLFKTTKLLPLTTSNRLNHDACEEFQFTRVNCDKDFKSGRRIGGW